MRRTGRGGIAALAIAAATAVAAACGDAPERRNAGAEALPEDASGVKAVTPARYVTDVTFVPFAADAPSLHLRFGNVTGSDRLERSYAGWRLEGGAWRPALTLRDTLPAPRAGWRVLPAGGLRVIASDEGGLDGLVLRDSADETGLELGPTLARWQGPTGQAEQFRAATVTVGGARHDGLAVERRSAVPLEAPSRRGLDGFLLATDSAGRGIAVLRQGGTPPGQRPPAVDTSAVAYGWTEDGERSWSEVRLEALGRGGDAPTEGSPPAAWWIAIPGGGIRGRLAPRLRRDLADLVGDALDVETDASGRPVRLYALSGTLSVHGEDRSVRGVGVEAGER